MNEIIIAGRYQKGEKIGSGSFGEIYEGTDLEKNQPVAIKIENSQSKSLQLLYESKIIKVLEGGLGIPKVLWSGNEGSYNVMVMERLGMSLESLFSNCNHKFSLKTTLMIADQIICRVEYVHSKGFLHRDIKPDNFLIGTDKRRTIIYAIDFGLSKKFFDSRSNRHIPYRSGKSLIGTARYASFNAHAGIEQSRRDDLESVLYILIYFLKGSLPWQGINKKFRRDKYKEIMNRKKSIKPEELCADIPSEFKNLLAYIKSLKFEETPNYVYIRTTIKNLFFQLDYLYDYQYDWVSVQTDDLKNQITSQEKDRNLEGFKKLNSDQDEKSLEEDKNEINQEGDKQNIISDPSDDHEIQFVNDKLKKKCVLF